MKLCTMFSIPQPVQGSGLRPLSGSFPRPGEESTITICQIDTIMTPIYYTLSPHIM